MRLLVCSVSFPWEKNINNWSNYIEKCWNIIIWTLEMFRRKIFWTVKRWEKLQIFKSTKCVNISGQMLRILLTFIQLLPIIFESLYEICFIFRKIWIVWHIYSWKRVENRNFHHRNLQIPIQCWKIYYKITLLIGKFDIKSVIIMVKSCTFSLLNHDFLLLSVLVSSISVFIWTNRMSLFHIKWTSHLKIADTADNVRWIFTRVDFRWFPTNSFL